LKTRDHLKKEKELAKKAKEYNDHELAKKEERKDKVKT